MSLCYVSLPGTWQCLKEQDNANVTATTEDSHGVCANVTSDDTAVPPGDDLTDTGEML